MTESLAIAVGLAGGVLVSYLIGKAVLPALVNRSRNPDLSIKLSFAGAMVALLPAALLAVVVGATLGMPWGMPGLVLGVAAVFALVQLGGTFLGALLARLLKRPGA